MTLMRLVNDFQRFVVVLFDREPELRRVSYGRAKVQLFP